MGNNGNDNIEYDLEKLRDSGEINPEAALKNFASQQEFFDSLTSFANSAQRQLSEFDAYKLSSRNDSRREFLRAAKSLREILVSLGMGNAADDLSRLEIAAINKNEDTLTNELAAFRKKMEQFSTIPAWARKAEAPKKPPAAKTSAPKKPQKNARPTAKSGDSHIVLAVDDMQALLSSVVAMLLDHYAVMAVTNGKTALKVLEKHTPSLFLLDIDMPAMNGFELAAAIRSDPRFSETPIIFLTAKNTRNDVMTAISLGGNDYIVKPVEKDLLISKIKRYLP